MSQARFNVEVETAGFNRFLRSLAAIDPRASFSDVVRTVAVSVTQYALKKTKAASVASLRRSVEGREWTSFGGKRYKLDHRYPNPLWGKINTALKASLLDKKNRRGLSKQSWLWLGREMNAALQAPAYVARANASGRQHPQNAQTRERGTSADYALTLINRSPIVQAAGGKRALLMAMRGQTRRFETLMEKRFYRTAATRAAAYPGIFVR